MFLKILFIFCALLPLQIALNPWPGIDLAAARIFVVVFFLIFLAEGLRKKQLLLPSKMLFIPFFSFLALTLFSLFWATEFSWGARKVLFIFSLAPLFLLASSLLKNKLQAEKMAAAIVFGASIVSFIALLLFFSQFFLGESRSFELTLKLSAPFLGESLWEAVKKHPSLLVNIADKDYLRASGIFPDPHMFAFYLGMSFPLAVALVFKTPSDSRRKKILIVSALLIFTAWLFTFSRGAYLGILSLLIFPSFIMFKQKKFSFLLLLMLLLLSCLFSPVGQRFLSSFDPQEGSNQGRLEIWHHAIQTISANPFGVGIGNYPLAFSPAAAYRDPIYAHNTYLDIAAEMGLPSLLLFFCLIGKALGVFWRERKDPLFLAFGGSLLVFASHSLVDTPLYSIHVFSLLMLILGVAAADIYGKETA